MKLKILLLLAFLNISLYSQNIQTYFTKGMEAFNYEDYSGAYDNFKEILKQVPIDNEVYSSAVYYSAQCLIALNQKDGAASILNRFSKNHFTSNFRDKALFQLGTIYFELGRYDACRSTLNDLIDYYPESDFYGSANYWIGESFMRENKLKEAIDFLTNAVTKESQNRYVDYSLFSLASLYERENQFLNAVTYYEKLLSYYPDSKIAPYAQLRLGMCFYKMEEFDRAVLELSDPQIVKLPDEVQTEARLALSVTFTKLKEYQNAKENYMKILSGLNDVKTERQVKYSLAWINFQTGDYLESYRLFNLLSQQRLDTTAVSSLYWSGESKRYAGENESAVQIYNDFIKQYPSSPYVYRAYLQKGVIDFNNGAFEDAKNNLLKALSFNEPEHKIKTLVILGEIELNDKKYDEAIGYFDKASGIIDNEKNEYYLRSLLGLGIAHYYKSDFTASEKELEKIVSINKRFESDKVNLYLAELSFARGKFDKALENYNKVISDNNDIQKNAIYGKACCYFNLKDFVNASYYFNEFTSKYKKDKNFDDAKLRIAESYYGMKDFNEAAKAYSEVFKFYKGVSNNPEAYYQYAQALFKSGDLQGAVSKFSELVNKFPKSDYADDARYLVGWIYFKNNNYQKAIDEYNSILTGYKSTSITPLVIYSLGDTYYNMGNYDSAMIYYNKILTEHSGSKQVYDAVNGLVYSLMATNNLSRAISIIDEYVKNSPSSAYADKIYLKKGELYYSQANYNEAKNAYVDFISKYPKSNLLADAYYWAGKSAANVNSNIEAAKYFEVVINSYINSEVGLNSVIEMGKILSLNKDYNSEIKLYESVEKRFGKQDNQAEVLLLKALAYINNGDVSKAYNTLSYINATFVGSLFADKAKLELSIIEMARKKYETAESLLSEVVQNRRDEVGAKAQYYLGLAFYEQGKTDDAITALVRVRSVFAAYDEWFSRSLLKLGDCYVKLKDKKKAREMYISVKKSHPNDELGEEANKKLKAL